MTIKAHFDGKVFVPDEPVDLPVGTQAIIEQNAPVRNYITARELLDSGIIGIWGARQDIGDSVEFARQLRDRAQRREI